MAKVKSVSNQEAMADHKEAILALHISGGSSKDISDYLKAAFNIAVVPGLVYGFVKDCKSQGLEVSDVFVDAFKPSDVLKKMKPVPVVKRRSTKSSSSMDPYLPHLLEMRAKGKLIKDCRDFLADQGVDVTEVTLSSYLRKAKRSS